MKMSNRKAETFIEVTKQKNPDLILAMEVDKWWNKELKVLEKEYPYSHETINDVAYGMVVYSKFPMKNFEVEYLNNPKCSII